MKFDFGKYKGIIVSIALFLLLDASVLMMNFYISFEISADAEGVNIAGRQRMLSQRMMKALLDTKAQGEAVGEIDASMDELQFTMNLFDTTLQAFDVGGATSGASGTPVTLEPVQSPASIVAVREAKVIWQPFYSQLNQLMATDKTDLVEFSAQLDDAIAYGRENNLALLTLMNQLTIDLESVASSKATRLRWIQTVGITLAVINFFIIMFHFLRQLRESDEKIEAAQKQTREILDTVNEGLFLLDKDFRIGDQSSGELSRIFGRDHSHDELLSDYLKNIVSEKDLATTQSYVRLLFDPRKKQKLLVDLNPLRQVDAHIPSVDGSYTSKHLSFTFSRVVQDNQIVHVLVTVMDISRQVQLAKELDIARLQGQEQLEMLSVIVNSNSDMLKMFLNNSQSTFNQINLLLKSQVKTTAQYREKLNKIYSFIHNYKGEASSLDLTQFVDLAHTFESQLTELSNRSELSGNDFLSLAVQLERLIQQTEGTHRLVEKMSGVSLTAAGKGKESEKKIVSMAHVADLAERAAQRQAKSVELVCSGFNDHDLSGNSFSVLNTMVIQLVRNAVSHGIEPTDDRIASQKSETGQVVIHLVKRRNGEFQLSVEDDGEGVNVEKIRQVALEKGLFTEVELDQMDGRQITALIFHPDFSTKSDVDEDAGRGVGLHALREMVKSIGGKITISSRKGQGSTFLITLPETFQVLREAA